ncbi:SIMPL domain-containing protein [Flavobacterium sp. J372]|uniref:SIMPL domain-containing protein n=1 Tax=Flavobacterium sp. J372 TaxID=2898436 RepID=UPI002150D0D8|nr:SIMPL domain-containing protein [Flavobacterium sp. J372]MCR5861533.1 SIMPL domain-containing protein [Flavobacterium sp. J372]
MKYLTHTIVAALAVVIAAYLFSNAFKNRNQANDTISVTGLGKQDFVSDLIVWSGSFTRKSYALKDAYSALDQDREVIKQYLTSKGIKPEEIVFSAVSINKEFNYEYGENGSVRQQTFSGFSLSQTVTIESKEVDKVENISREVTQLINSGVEFYSTPPEYYYTKLAELKIKMIAEATKDAHARAESIAENAGSSLGSLKKSEMGVFQIIAQNSSEEYSWGGSFNTSSKKKTANITVKLAYQAN